MTTNRFTRRASAAALALSLLLGGCAVKITTGDTGSGGNKPVDPTNPQVTVRNGKVQVDQEVLYFKGGPREVLITWRLPAGGPYRFARNGIQFDKFADGQIVRCGIGKLPTEYTCLNIGKTRNFYKYDVNVLEGDKPLPPLDPFIINDW